MPTTIGDMTNPAGLPVNALFGFTRDLLFLSNYGGAVELVNLETTAVTDGPLPGDDVAALVSIG